MLVDTFRDTVKGAHDYGTFAAGLCGPNSVLVSLVSELLESQPDEGSLRQFQGCLDDLNGKIVANRYIPPVHKTEQDATLAGRWAGLYQLVRSWFWERAEPGFGECLRAAKGAFDRVWNATNLGGAAALPTIADGPVNSAEKDLFSRVNPHLRPWTPGSWMVWDVLCQWNHTADPVAVEITPVLFAGGSEGQALRLVVEALPGPPGLVVPNWWRLGLCSFKTGNPERSLPAAVGRVIRLAAANAGLRFRWHLDAVGAPQEAWKYGLDGRSIEAAAAVATLAVLEQYEERRQQPDGQDVEPILDPRSVVTGVVGHGGDLNLLDWPIEPVNKDTLPAKIKAAEKHGLDVIAVPASQRNGLAAPQTVRLEGVPTVGEAFDLLRSVNRAFDRYGEYVRSLFKYHEEETPAAS